MDETGALILPDLPRAGYVWLLLHVAVQAYRATGAGSGVVSKFGATLRYQDGERMSEQIASDTCADLPVTELAPNQK